MLPSTGKLKLLQLEGNPWQCDCRLLHLLPLSSPPPCDQLQDCPSQVIAFTKKHQVLECHTSGWPHPKVIWWKDGDRVSPEALKLKEDVLRKPVHIFSTLEDPHPGNYTCQAGESSATILVESMAGISRDPTYYYIFIPISLLLFLLFLLLFFLWRRSHKRKKEDSMGLTTSLAGLEYRSTKLSTTNPVPKPPRTFTSSATTLALVEPPLIKAVTFPPSTPHFDNKPRSRASIGTVSLNSTFFEASPCVSPRNSSQYPCCGAPPGYATLPKRFIAPPLGPRCSGDGSSFASLNLSCGGVAPITVQPITSTPANASLVNTPINTSGLPPSYSPMPPRPLQTIEEQE